MTHFLDNTPPKVIAENILGKTETDEFALWAFGENYMEKFSKELIWAWNERHAKKLRISLGGTLEEDIPKMIELWKNGMKEKLCLALNVLKTISSIGDNLSHIECESNVYTFDDEAFGNVMCMRDIADECIRNLEDAKIEDKS